MTHRDPAKVVPSYTSLVSQIMAPSEGARDLCALGREVCDHLRVGMEHAIAERTRVGEDRFLDVHHRDLVEDPPGTIEHVYDWLGLELDAATEKTMREWQAANQMGSSGSHIYRAEQFGLSVGQIRAEYDFYIRRFAVTLEEEP